jgi:hypothetical protein
MQQLLEPLQWLLVLHFGDAAGDTQPAGDSLIPDFLGIDF